MSFADYLRDRISNDYKNLMIQKLEEIRQQTEELKNSLTPSFNQNHETLREIMRNEFASIQTLMEKELDSSQGRLTDYFNSLIENHISAWYHSDVSQFEQQLEVLLSDIVSNLPAPPKKKSSDLESLSNLMRKIDQQNTQSEILNILLMHISGWVDRAILFVVKGDQAAGWAALGLAGEWDTNRVRALKVSLNQQTILSEVARTGELAYGPADKYPDNGQIYLTIGSRFPSSVLACPIYVRGKIAGILYCDLEEDFSEKPDVPQILFLATRSAGFAIDLLPMKPKIASAQAPVQQPVQASPQVITPPPVPPPVPAPEPEPEVAEAEQVAEAIPEPELEPELEMDSEAQAEAEGTVIMPVAAPVAPVIPEEEQKLHDDAKRFARLLVSEIKLYNEAQVSAGREHRDLYDRLREDIERSRRMYMDRVPIHIHSSTNYFYEELVRTLANGDPTLLGM
jgi:hypothetical protein